MNISFFPDSPLSWIFLVLEAVAAAVCLVFFLRSLRKSGSELNVNKKTDDLPAAPQSPKVSVVVYSQADEELLTQYLSSLCLQDYPDFEVIVVCDASFETSGMLSEKYSEMFQRVYVTFVPPGSHNLSRRKLALTLGIKAAKGDVVIITVDNSLIPSDRWISAMARPFIENPDIELVLGYSHADLSPLGRIKRAYRGFTTLLSDSLWIGYALDGKPYRGDGFNMAMKREAFFRLNGFSKTRHLHSGEDDLFVNEWADAANTAVAIEPDAILTTLWGEATERVTTLRRSQYDFTSRWLPRAPFRMAGAASCSQWIVPAAAVAAVLTSLPSIIPAIAAGIVWLTFVIMEGKLYRKAAVSLCSPRLSWQIPFFWLWKPIGNLIFRLSHRSTRFKNYTWQRHK